MAVSSLPRGTSFTRVVLAMAKSALHGGGGLSHAAAIASQWRDSPEVEAYLKASVSAGNATDTNWAKPLAPFRSIADEFLELVRPATIIGRLAGLRRVPFKISIPRETAAPVGYWVDEGLSTPISAGAFDSVQVDARKAASIIVVTKELIERFIPGTEALLQRSLVRSVAQFIDVQFIDPSITGTTARPASITNGATAVASTGSTVDAISADLKALVGVLVNAGILLSNPYFILNPITASALTFKRNTDGTLAFPGVNVAGGTLFGIPIVTSTSVPASIIVLLDASEILLADDGAVTLDASEEAALQMRDDPASGVTTLVSVWQANLIGIKATREINYERARDGAVAVLAGVAY